MSRVGMIVLAAALAAVVPAAADPGAAPTGAVVQASGFVEYTGPGFVMVVPTEWRKTSNPQFDALFLAAPENGFGANLGVAILPGRTNATVEEVARSAKQFQGSDYNQFKVIKEGGFALAGRPAYRRVYTWRHEVHGVEMRQTQVWVKNGTILYVMTASSLATLAGKYEPIFERMLTSFVFRP